MNALNRFIEKHGIRLAGLLFALLLLGTGLTVLNAKPAEVRITGEPIVVDEEQLLRVNLNTAAAEELEELPKIGEVLAARIVASREQNGSFRTIDDLKRVQGITQSVIDAIRDKVTL